MNFNLSMEGGITDPEILLIPLGQLHATFNAEINSHRLLYPDQSRVSYLELADPFGGKVAKAFPRTSFDIQEAAKCYALERDTACVLHLMRVLEVGLITLGKKLHVDLNEASWQNILNSIASALKKIENDSNRPKNWKQNRQLYSDTAAQFSFFKDAWRNYAMHARQKYTRAEALNIYDHVKVFMQHLASKLAG